MKYIFLVFTLLSTAIADSEFFCCRTGPGGPKTTFSKDMVDVTSFWRQEYAPWTPDIAAKFCNNDFSDLNVGKPLATVFHVGHCDIKPPVPAIAYPPDHRIEIQGNEFPNPPSRRLDGTYCHPGAFCIHDTKQCAWSKNSIKCAWKKLYCASVDQCGASPDCWDLYNKWQDFDVSEHECIHKNECIPEVDPCCKEFKAECYACKMCLSIGDYCLLSEELRTEGDLGVPEGCFCRAGSFSIAGDTMAPCQLCPDGQGNAGGNDPCVDCVAGEYSKDGSDCQTCPYPSFTTEPGQSECTNATVTECELGQAFTAPTTTTEGVCTDCEVAHYAPTTKTTSCIFCEPGKYNDEVKQSSCEWCPDDTTNGGATSGSESSSDSGSDDSASSSLSTCAPVDPEGECTPVTDCSTLSIEHDENGESPCETTGRFYWGDGPDDYSPCCENMGCGAFDFNPDNCNAYPGCVYDAGDEICKQISTCANNPELDDSEFGGDGGCGSWKVHCTDEGLYGNVCGTAIVGHDDNNQPDNRPCCADLGCAAFNGNQLYCENMPGCSYNGDDNTCSTAVATPTITDNRDSVDECRACTITQDCRVRTSVNGGTCVRDRDTGEFGCSGQTEARNGKNWCNLVEPITIAGLEHTFDHCVVHCAAGHEPQLHAAVGPEFYICGPCPDGKRSAHYDKHVCSLCAENQYTDDKETCKDCVHEGALEWVVSLNGRISNDECLPSKCAAGYALQNNACVKCSGTEWSAEGATACVADTVELNGCTLNEHFVPGTSHTEDDGACVKDTVQQYNCVAGEYYQIGTNSADDSACLACANNQHSAANSNSCTDDTLSVPSDCAANEYFIVGTSNTEDDGACAACSEPDNGQYVSTACSDTDDTVIDTCSEPTTGNYVSTICASGSHSAAGTDTQTTACSANCPSGQYKTVNCAAGSWGETGQDITCTACADACGAGEEETTACSTSDNRVCTACGTGKYSTDGSACQDHSTSCGTGEYKSADGSASADITCTTCADACGAGTEETTACSFDANRVCTACGTGKYSTDGSACQDHSTSCNGAEYKSADGTASADITCTTCTNCGAGKEEATSCSFDADRTCQDCATGKYSEDNGDCQDHSTTCDAGKYKSADGTATADITCTDCDTCSNGLNYETTACTFDTNRVCTQCQNCGNNEYGQGCENGEDRTCHTCATCSTGQYISTACSGDTNTQCTACSVTSCSGSNMALTPCTGTQTEDVSSCNCEDGFTDDGNGGCCVATGYTVDNIQASDCCSNNLGDDGNCAPPCAAVNSGCNDDTMCQNACDSSQSLVCNTNTYMCELAPSGEDSGGDSPSPSPSPGPSPGSGGGQSCVTANCGTDENGNPIALCDDGQSCTEDADCCSGYCGGVKKEPKHVNYHVVDKTAPCGDDYQGAPPCCDGLTCQGGQCLQ